eukprot:2440064-Pyramimonas_sp.AAC.1
MFSPAQRPTEGANANVEHPINLYSRLPPAHFFSSACSADSATTTVQLMQMTGARASATPLSERTKDIANVRS